MDENFQTEVKKRLEDYVKQVDPSVVNDPLVAIEYLKCNGISLTNIYDNVKANIKLMRDATRKNDQVCRLALQEASCGLDNLKHNSKLDRKSKLAQANSLLALVDRALVNCVPSAKDTMGHILSIRAELLFECGQTEFALTAINRAICLCPSDALMHVYKVRYLDSLNRHYEAFRLCKGFLRIWHTARTIEEATDEVSANVQLLKQLQIELDKRIQKTYGPVDSDDSDDDCEQYDSSDEDGIEDSYNSDTDYVEQDFVDEAFAEQSRDELFNPHGHDDKNFSLDYRCELQAAKPGKGRSVTVSEESIAADTTIFREKPYSLVVLPDATLTHCHYCARPVTNRFWPCVACNESVYCGPNCAQSDWRLSHRFDCGLGHSTWLGTTRSGMHVFKLLNRFGVHRVLQVITDNNDNNTADGHTDPNYELHAYRNDQMQRVTNEVDKSDNLRIQTYTAQQQLLHHSSEHSPAYFVHHFVNAVHCAVLACLAQNQELDDTELALLIEHSFVAIRRFLINAFRWSERPEGSTHRKQYICTSMYLLGSTFNHSCDPNTAWLINSGQLFLYTLRQIEPGEEITISYGPISGSNHFEERQKRLSEGYYFQCGCRACVDDCRLVAALHCGACAGPVLCNAFDADLDSHCLACRQTLDNTAARMALLKHTLDSVTFQCALLTEVQPSSSAAVAESVTKAQQSLKLVRSLIYEKSALLVQCIYQVCQVLMRQRPHQIDRCVRYGVLVDFILPPSGTGLIVLPAVGDGGDNLTTAQYFTSSCLQPNIDHLLFWCSLYKTYIAKTECQQSHIWAEMFRFYGRLQRLVKWAVKNNDKKLAKLTKNQTPHFELAYLESNINALEEVYLLKKQELEQFKQSIPQSVLTTKDHQ